jgi:signal transduction histidine kinase
MSDAENLLNAARTRAGVEPGRILERAERILACSRPVLGHDLPNALVAIQGLLKVLELEEGDHLSSDGREYLRRVTAATQRAQGMVRLLKDLARAGEEPGPVECIALDDLFREVTAVMKQLYPGRPAGYDFNIEAPVVAVPRRLLHQALAQLLHNVIPHLPEVGPRLAMGSRDTPTGIEVWVADGAQVPPAGKPASDEGARRESRLGFALVGELADAWGGMFRISSDTGSGNLYTLLIPAR